MKRVTLFLSCVLFICCSTKSSSKKTNSFSIKHTAEKKLDSFPISKLAGGWCWSVKDSIDFSITLVVKHDSIFGEYSSIVSNGKYLNTDDDQKIWAFKIPYTIILDTSKYFPITNFYDNSTAHLKIEFDEKNDVLIWKLQEDNDNTPFLPHYATLHRCKEANVDGFQ
ncbi:MAG: hypothetical protein PW786_03565 [Arachidicoccus sp.]|nr:hypothetical protein [Arachidicoccus sp.]